jgi:hypothetical protein
MAFKRTTARAAFDVGRYDNAALERIEDHQAGGATGAGERALGTQIRLGNKTVTLPATDVGPVTNYYVDGTDSLANRGLTINLVHVPTGNGVRFKAFLMAFNESYNSDWSSESVYGRADPIHMFKQTSRSISLSWKIVAATESEAVENLVRLQSFLQMLYPTYMEPNEAQTINQSPLIRLQMSNMVRKSAASKNLGDLRSADVSADTNTGLLGIIKNVSVTHNMENPDIGVFELGTRASVDDAGENSPGVPTNNIVPKSIEVQMDFSVVHEHMLGWTKSATGAWTFGGGSAAGEETAFPYYVKDGSEVNSSTLTQRLTANQAWIRSQSIAASSETAIRTSYAALLEAEAEVAVINALMESGVAGLNLGRRLIVNPADMAEAGSDYADAGTALQGALADAGASYDPNDFF